MRVERCVEHENAALVARVRLAEADFVAPEGCPEAEAERLRDEAGKLALFDPSPEAVLARRYEAEARRGFFRALKELRAHERAMVAARAEAVEGQLASILDGDMTDEEFDALEVASGPGAPRGPSERVESDLLAGLRARVDVPMTIGRRR